MVPITASTNAYRDDETVVTGLRWWSLIANLVVAVIITPLGVWRTGTSLKVSSVTSTYVRSACNLIDTHSLYDPPATINQFVSRPV